MARLIEEFAKMPGIGPRSAERLTFHILQSSREETDSLIHYLKEVKDKVRFCGICNNLSEEEVCYICSDPSRDKKRICVVEGPRGVIAMEKSGIYNGVYHVLLGELSPIEGVGPEELKIDELVKRAAGEVEEIIIATDFTQEGETTALYINELLKDSKCKVTRLARGVPVGAILQFADVATVQRAFEERRGV